MGVIHYITQVNFDFGAVKTLAAECERVGLRRPLFVTDRGVVAAGVAARAFAAVGERPWAVYDGTPANPTEAAVIAATAKYQEHEADGLIAVGGGSSIDLAKGVAILATHPGPLARYATILGGSPLITAKAAPVIAIPTTAGTGSDVARGSIIVLNDGRKLGFHSWHLVPRVSIADPELTYGLPPGLTAATGMDAMAHCIETYLSRAFNPPANAIAFDGLRRAVAHIQRAVADGQDATARMNMMAASMHGAMAFQKGLGAVHSLSHALGALPVNPHHGTLNAVLLPEVLRFNAAVVEASVMEVAGVFGAMTVEQLAERVRALNHAIGLPSGLRAMGIGEDTYDRVADHALLDHCHATNPRLATKDDYLGILQRSA
jgi:4-hydroxybutyrate dehydrogenase